jgi:hypothetical protein
MQVPRLLVSSRALWVALCSRVIPRGIRPVLRYARLRGSEVRSPQGRRDGSGQGRPSRGGQGRRGTAASDFSFFGTQNNTEVLNDFDFDSFLHEDDSPFSFEFTTVPEEKPDSPEMTPFKLPFSFTSYTTNATDFFLKHCYKGHCKSAKPKYGAGGSSHKRKLQDRSSSTCFCTSFSSWNPSEKKIGMMENFITVSCGDIKREEDISALLAPGKFSGAQQAKENASQTCLYEPVFLGHAQVWVFADRYGITSLMDLAGARLAYAMTSWKMSENTFISDLGALTRYSYENTLGKSFLRSVVPTFAACVVEDVLKLDGWSTLCGRSGEGDDDAVLRGGDEMLEQGLISFW